MEDKNTKFRLRLNLFDAVVILAALAVAVLLLWMRMRPAVTTSDTAIPAASRVQYTILLKKTIAGTGELVKSGDVLVDTIKNYELGCVTGVEVKQAQRSIINEETCTFVMAEIPGYEDIYIQMESTATYSDQAVLVGGGYEVRVGEPVYVRGPGYLGSGEVYAIERGA